MAYPPNVLESLLSRFTYAAILGLLLAGGVGAPVPEELIQVTAGYLARRGLISFLPALGVAWIGLVVGDAMLFRLARRHGPKLLEAPRVARLLTPQRRAALERHYARHAFLTVMAGRHLSVLRVPIFVLAGASGFCSVDTIGAEPDSSLQMACALRISDSMAFLAQRCKSRQTSRP